MLGAGYSYEDLAAYGGYRQRRRKVPRERQQRRRRAETLCCHLRALLPKICELATDIHQFIAYVFLSQPLWYTEKLQRAGGCVTYSSKFRHYSMGFLNYE